MSVELGQQGIEALSVLRDQAALREITLDKFLQQLADAGGNGPVESPLSTNEIERFLDELASGPPLPILPVDFSRADIYAEHD